MGARNLRALGLVIPQMGKGEYRIDQRYNAEFSDKQYVSSQVVLNWDLYRRWKGVTDDFSQAAEMFTTKTVLTVRFPEGLEVEGDQFRTIREVRTVVGLGPIVVEAEPM